MITTATLGNNGETGTHAAVVSGPVHHRLVVRRVSRQGKSGGVQMRFTLPRVRPSGVVPAPPVVSSGVGHCLDRLPECPPCHRFSSGLPIQIFRHTFTSFYSVPPVRIGVFWHRDSCLILPGTLSTLFATVITVCFDGNRRQVFRPISRRQRSACFTHKRAKNFCALVGLDQDFFGFVG